MRPVIILIRISSVAVTALCQVIDCAAGNANQRANTSPLPSSG
jgi:hypothetical protein